jgi:amino acid adenylation domain-containing protein
MPVLDLTVDKRLWTGAGEAIRTTDGRCLDYDELRAAADGLATRMIAQGFRAGMAAAIVSTRTPEAVVAIFATWRAGGTIVPIDAAWPPSRVENAFAKANVACSFVDGNAARHQSTWRLNGAEWALTDPITGKAADHAPAYVIFTSGSTGEPKGVAVSHAALGNYLGWRARALRLPPGFRVLAMASLGFDVMLREIVWPLTVGGTVVLLPDEQRMDSSLVVAALREHQIDVVHMLSSMFELVAAEPGLSGLPRLKVVHASAEPLSSAAVRKFRAISQAAVHHSYGPTEATISVTFQDCGDLPASAWDIVPLGTPIANVEIHLRDNDLRPVASGQVGEICLAGPCLADGYVGAPEATAAVFVTDPTDHGRLLYRTGDRAVVTEEGALLFRGRVDDQIKVRGHRIEPAEVEAALQRFGAREAVVGSDLTGTQLVALVTGDPAPDPQGLRAALADVMPSSMVPDRVQVVDAFERTASGKIDRAAALRRIRSDGPKSASGNGIAQDDVYAAIAEVWASVLGHHDPAPSDNFFDIGGNSMNAMRIASRLRKKLGGRVQVRLLFDHPVLGDLSAAISAQLASGGDR